MAFEGSGPVIARRHGGVAVRMWGRAGLLALDLWLVACVVRILVGAREDFVRDAVGLLLAVAALVLVLAAAAVWRARRHVYELHEHSLTLRRRGASGAVVIPWASVDPGRVLLSSPTRLPPTWWPAGWLRWALAPPVVLVNGSDDSSGSPFAWWRLEVADPVDLLTAIESAMIAGGQPAQGLAADVIGRRQPAGVPTQLAMDELERGPAEPARGLPRD